MSRERYTMSTCPKCGSPECVTRVTKQFSTVSCNKCGMRRQLQVSPHPRMGHFIATTQDLPRVRRTHPHHYLAAMLAFLALASFFLFLQFSKTVVALH